jgi:hypothetical protein
VPEKINYRSVLRDLKERQKKLAVAIEAIEDLLSSEASEKARVDISPNGESASAAVISNPISMVDAAFKVLKEAGEPLHATEIAKRINSKFNKTTNMNSIAASLPQEAKRRFKRTAANTFGLKEWAEK